MMVETERWLVSLPTWATVTIVMAVVAGFAVLGLLASHQLVSHGVRRSHNDLAGFTLSVVGVIYAVLLAFIAVAVWDDFRGADALVQTEADLVGDLYRDTAGIDPAPAAALRLILSAYAETVIKTEWPALTQGRVDEETGWQRLNEFHIRLAGETAVEPGKALLIANMEQSLDRLYDARRGRFHEAGAELPPILRWNLFAGACLIIVFSYLFGAPDFRMHLAMVTMLSASIGLVLALILVLSHPFQGPNHVSAEPFERLGMVVQQMSFPQRE